MQQCWNWKIIFRLHYVTFGALTWYRGIIVSHWVVQRNLSSQGRVHLTDLAAGQYAPVVKINDHTIQCDGTTAYSVDSTQSPYATETYNVTNSVTEPFRNSHMEMLPFCFLMLLHILISRYVRSQQTCSIFFLKQFFCAICHEMFSMHNLKFAWLCRIMNIFSSRSKDITQNTMSCDVIWRRNGQTDGYTESYIL